MKTKQQELDYELGEVIAGYDDCFDCEYDSIDLVKAINNGANVNAPNCAVEDYADPMTPLQLCVSKKKLSYARILLSYGADLCLECPQGKPPLEMAREEGLQEFIDLFEGGQKKIGMKNAN